MPSFSDEPGKLYILDLLHPQPHPVELQIKGGLDLSSFNPHGISIYVNERGDWQPKHTMSNIKRVLYVWEDQAEPFFFMIENFDLLFNFEKEKCVFMLSLQRHKYL